MLMKSKNGIASRMKVAQHSQEADHGEDTWSFSKKIERIWCGRFREKQVDVRTLVHVRLAR